MGIERLEIKGFRSLRDVVWEPGRLNVLIGPNASGKSNLLDACALLRESAHGKLNEGVVRRGGMAPLVWDGQAGSISWFLSTREDSGLEYALDLTRLGANSGFMVEYESLADSAKERREFFYRSPGSAMVLDSSGEQVPFPDRVSDTQTLLSLVSGPFAGIPKARIFRGWLETWSIYELLRVDRDSLVRQASVARYEKQIAPDGQNLTAVLHTLYTSDREFRRTVDAAMSAAFGDDYDELLFPPAADQRVQLRLRWRSLQTEQSAASLSDGTLRFLILVAILANPDPGALIAIDEPEAGLHPRMFSILAELAQDAAERTQVVFTTHSPEFLDAFTGEPPTTTVAERVAGETRLKNVDGEELRRWLREYSLGSLFRSGDLEALA
jgi:predicted ATPase